MSTIIANYECLPLSFLLFIPSLTIKVITNRYWRKAWPVLPSSLKLNLRFRSFPVPSSQKIFREHLWNSFCESIDSSAIALHDEINLSIQKTKRLGDMTFGSHMVFNISLRPKLISLLGSARASLSRIIG